MVVGGGSDGKALIGSVGNDHRTGGSNRSAGPGGGGDDIGVYRKGCVYGVSRGHVYEGIARDISHAHPVHQDIGHMVVGGGSDGKALIGPVGNDHRTGGSNRSVSPGGGGDDIGVYRKGGVYGVSRGHVYKGIARDISHAYPVHQDIGHMVVGGGSDGKALIGPVGNDHRTGGSDAPVGPGGGGDDIGVNRKGCVYGVSRGHVHEGIARDISQAYPVHQDIGHMVVGGGSDGKALIGPVGNDHRTGGSDAPVGPGGGGDDEGIYGKRYYHCVMRGDVIDYIRIGYGLGSPVIGNRGYMIADIRG